MFRGAILLFSQIFVYLVIREFSHRRRSTASKYAIKDTDQLLSLMRAVFLLLFFCGGGSVFFVLFFFCLFVFFFFVFFWGWGMDHLAILRS